MEGLLSFLVLIALMLFLGGLPIALFRSLLGKKMDLFILHRMVARMFHKSATNLEKQMWKGVRQLWRSRAGKDVPTQFLIGFGCLLLAVPSGCASAFVGFCNLFK